VEPGGWAHFDHVKMPDYRWGIFLAPAEAERKIHFGEHLGDRLTRTFPESTVPTCAASSSRRAIPNPRRLSSNALGLTCRRSTTCATCSRSTSRKAVTWAMVYLLHRYFGRDGREEAEELLQRRSGDTDNPRILGAFNEKTPDWLAFFMFTYFTETATASSSCAHWPSRASTRWRARRSSC
jgi:benzoyl-CoA 2,3-dioxygenase component B